ncbi:MAG TPA: hypothetical protein VMK31_09275 [Sphingomicrobium sp.]|nr:hypothetical protein [Sphingomicrobium sp.]
MLSLQEFASVVLLLSMAGAAAVLGNAGFSQSLIKLLNPANQDSLGPPDSLIAAGLLTSAALGSAFAVILLAAPGLWVEESQQQLSRAGAIGAALCLAYVIQLYLGEVLRAQNKVFSATILGNFGTYGGTLQNAVTLAWVAFLVPGSNDPLGTTILGLLLASLACLAPLILSTMRNIDLGVSKLRRLNLRKLADMNGSNLVSTGLFQVRGHIFLWSGALVVSASELAIYSASNRLAAVFALPAIVITYSVSYYLVARPGEEGRQVETRMRSLVTLVSLAVAPGLLALIIFADRVGPLLLGAGYAAVGPVLILQSLLGYTHIVMGGSSQALPLNGHHRKFMAYTFWSSSLGLALLVPLAARYGALGMVAASLITVWFHYALILRAVQRHGLPRSHSYIRPAQIRAALSSLHGRGVRAL